MTRRRIPRPDDRGESLIEVLVTIVVIGITVPAIMGAVLLSVATSDQDRRQVQAQALLASWSAAIVRETTDTTYPGCPTLAHYAKAPFLPSDIPDGFTPRVVSIDYWVKASGSGQGSFSSACSVDAGLRRLRLAVDVSENVLPAFRATHSIVVRRPCLAC